MEVRRVKWQKTTSPSGSSGKVFFPWSFPGMLPLEIATGELLSYYGCRIANSCAGKILLGKFIDDPSTYDENKIPNLLAKG